jgi:superfamily II DNA or RNA helicase
MFSYFCHSIIGKGKRVIVLAHRDELLDQISNTLKEFDVTHSFIAAGRPYNYKDSVHVASVFSAVRRLKRLQPPDVIIIDEAHHAIRNSTWDRVLTAFPKAWRIGVTATAGRTSGEPLKDIFDSLILGPTVSELIEIG